MNSMPCRQCTDHHFPEIPEPTSFGCLLCQLDTVCNMNSPYFTGYFTSLDGKPERHTENTNPYPRGTYERREWDRGFREAISDMMRYEQLG